MNLKNLSKILEQVEKGLISANHAKKSLKHIFFEDINYAHIDHHRSIRKGFPEVIYGQGKTAFQIINIIKSIEKYENIILTTRVNPEKALEIQKSIKNIKYHKDAKVLVLKKSPPKILAKGEILIISAGTSDIPVAKEAYITAQVMGNKVKSLFDVGVAGIHRLFAHKDLIEKASVIVVAAGMEGALPSVVAGLVKAPVIAVPTSIGYGASFKGVTALLGMLNSCSPNIAVVNIDNGFGAGYMASTINQNNI
ncbi:MAG: 1-(5-phosphoribosyl)-5-amino-4-imidazole-carboxylate carboxylase [Desulfobacteraceae bacterium 4572_130]|nr:MAG: 1-(5-phosphoribosyl)-5-amino-4-imidazole-carboxylate carboxylase [Desulfobacteraceae bacterium 4572_130]